MNRVTYADYANAEKTTTINDMHIDQVKCTAQCGLCLLRIFMVRRVRTFNGQYGKFSNDD